MGLGVALIAEVHVEAATVARSLDAALVDDSSSAGEAAGALDLACAADDVEVPDQNVGVEPVVHVVAVEAAEPVAESGGQSLAAAEAARLSQDRLARRRHPARDVPHAAPPVPRCPAVL